MNPEILIRLSLSLLIIGLGFGFFRVMNTLLLARTRTKARQFPDYQAGQLSILYFTTPACVPCRVIQKPALQQVHAMLGDRLQVIEVDATEKPEMAKEWNVLSVPTTFLIDAQGIARFVNHGATRAEKLLEQIEHL
jgi:thiol-disulfide isomerase/thioredoxin